MNYAYNVKVNFKKNLFNFYEWKKQDNIEILPKVLVFLVDNKTYKDILHMQIKVNNIFLNKIISNNLMCIFCTEIDTVCVKFTTYGQIELISKLLLEEEKDILDNLSSINEINLEYVKVNCKMHSYSNFTREEEKNINKILNFLSCEKQNQPLIDYIYYEWFNKNNYNNKYDCLVNAVKKEYSFKHEKILKIIEIVNLTNV